MAAIPTTRRFNPSDFKGLPDTFTGRFLSQLNLFTDPVWVALNNGLTVQQNMNGFIYSFQVIGAATPAAVKFILPNTFSGRPFAVQLVQANLASDITAPLTNQITINSWYTDSGNVFITAIGGLTSGTTYNLTVLVI